MSIVEQHTALLWTMRRLALSYVQAQRKVLKKGVHDKIYIEHDLSNCITYT